MHFFRLVLAFLVPGFSVNAFAMSLESTWEMQRRFIPQSRKPIIIGYAHNVKSGKAEQAIKDGANVIIWSFLHFDASKPDASSQQQKGIIKTDLDLDAVLALRTKYIEVVHLAAFGGWNGPHPPSALNGEEWCEVFMDFNKANGYLFDGIDWDYEGHDDLNSPRSKFTLETLNIMADFSVYAKRKYEMIVSMAPAESYLDAMAEEGSLDASFSLNLDLPPRAWTSSNNATDEDRELIQSVGFSHAGRQCYAYVLAKAGLDIFDWISIQLYEAYSPFAHALSHRKVDPVDALMARIRRLTNGYTITEIPDLTFSEYHLKVPLNKLVIGVANKWADGLKFCKVKPECLKSTYQSTLSEYGQGFLGVMFWVSY
jgi:chitinase